MVANGHDALILHFSVFISTFVFALGHIDNILSMSDYEALNRHICLDSLPACFTYGKIIRFGAVAYEAVFATLERVLAVMKRQP